MQLFGYRVKRSMLVVFWHRQRLLQNIVSHLYFGQNWPTLQRGLSGIAELLVLSRVGLVVCPVSPDVALLPGVHCRGRWTAEFPREFAWIGDWADHSELGQTMWVSQYTEVGLLRTTVATPHLYSTMPSKQYISSYTIECMSQWNWVNVWKKERMNECMNEWMN